MKEMVKTIDQSEMLKLAIALTARGTKFIFRSFYNGLQILCDDWDAICHNGSYGHERGLIEVMGLPQCDDDVIGYLTAEQVLNLLDGGEV